MRRAGMGWLHLVPLSVALQTCHLLASADPCFSVAGNIHGTDIAGTLPYMAPEGMHFLLLPECPDKLSPFSLPLKF